MKDTLLPWAGEKLPAVTPDRWALPTHACFPSLFKEKHLLILCCHAGAVCTGCSEYPSIYTTIQPFYRWGASNQSTGWGPHPTVTKHCRQQWAMNIHILLYLFMYHQRAPVPLQVVGTGAAFHIKCFAVSKQLWGRSVITADAVCLSSPCLHKWTYGLLAQGQLIQSLIRYNFSLFNAPNTKICPLAAMLLCCRNFLSLWFVSSDEEELIPLPVTWKISVYCKGRCSSVNTPEHPCGFLLTSSGKQVVSLQAEDGHSPLSLQHAIPKIFCKSTITAQQGIMMAAIVLCCQARRASHQTHGSNHLTYRHTSCLYKPKWTWRIVGVGLFLNELSERELRLTPQKSQYAKYISGKRRKFSTDFVSLLHFLTQQH